MCVHHFSIHRHRRGMQQVIPQTSEIKSWKTVKFDFTEPLDIVKPSSAAK